jgi:hypothetical protein
MNNFDGQKFDRSIVAEKGKLVILKGNLNWHRRCIKIYKFRE